MAAVEDVMSGRDVLKNCPDDRWAWVEIDLGALRANVRTFKTLLERSEEHTSELQSLYDLVCRLLLEK